MPKVIKTTVDGVEKEETVYTQEEIDAQKKTADDAAAAVKVEADKAAADLAQAKKDLDAARAAGGSDKDFNFRQLEERVKAAEKSAEDAKTSAAATVVTMQNTALQAAIKGLAGEDAELAKKVEFHFNTTLKNVDGTKSEDFTKKLQQAYLLAAAGEIKPGSMNGGIYGSGGAGPGAGRPGNGGSNQTLPPIKPEVIDMGKRFLGLTEDDFKKYDKWDVSRTK